MKSIKSVLFVAGIVAAAGGVRAETFSLQGEYWGNTSAPNGWVDSGGGFGQLPGPNDTARATTLCDSPLVPPCANVYLQVVNTHGPVTTTVRSFDGSGRRLYIGAGGSLWATNESQVGGIDFTGGQLTTSSRFTIGTMTVNDAGSAVRSVMTAPNSGQFVLLGATAVQGGLDLKATAGEIQNKGTLTQSGNGNMALYFGFDFRNLSGGVVDLKNDNGIEMKDPSSDITAAGPIPIQFHNEAGAMLKKTGGSGTSVIEAPIVNAGTISATSGQLHLAGGGTHSDGAHLEAIGPGVVALLGAHAVTGTVTTAGDGGVYVGDFGKPGSLTIANGGTLLNSGRLFQNDTLTVQAGGEVENTQDGSFYAYGDTRIASGGSFVNKGTMQLEGKLVNEGTFEIQNGGKVSGLSSGNRTFDQRAGTTDIRLGGSFDLNALNDGGGTYLQTGGTTIVNGTLKAGTVRFESGDLKGNGSIFGDVVIAPVVNQGGSFEINPANSPGRLTIDGNFMASGAIFNIEIAGPPGLWDYSGLYDQIFVTGNATIVGGFVNFMFIDGFLPDVGVTFDWLSATSTFFDPDNPLGFKVWTSFGSVDGELQDGRFLVTNVERPGPDPDPVPEPGTLALLGLGLTGLMLTRRRRLH